MLAGMSTASDLRRQWFPPRGEESPAYAAKHRVADDVRAVIERLVAVDVEAVDPQELAALERTAAQLRRGVEGLPDLRRRGPLARAPLPEGALVERSPVSGRGNALAIPLDYTFDGDITRATAVFSAAYEGPPGGVHGGYVAAAFDELLGSAQSLGGRPGMTGNLSIDYRSPTPLHTELHFAGWVDRVEGRKTFTVGTLHAGDRLCAEARGLFIAIDVRKYMELRREREERLGGRPPDEE